MSAKRARLPRERVLKSCAWCHKRIPANTPVYSLTAKARPGVDLQSVEGNVMSMELTRIKRSVWAIVPPNDSDAKREGNDFVFMICSPACGTALRQALQQEISLVDRVNG